MNRPLVQGSLAMTLVLLGLWAGGCSFTTASGFEECQSDPDCASSSVCSKHYCLPLVNGCQRTEGIFDAGERIPIGAMMALTTADGGQNDREVYRLDAMRLAISEANKQGLNGIPFALYACNTGSDVVQIKAQTNWLITNLQVPAIIVSGSDRLLAAESEPSRLDAGTFLISPNATSASLVSSFRVDGNVWRVAPPDTIQAAVLAGLLDAGSLPDAGATLAVLTEDSDYGKAFLLAMSNELGNRGYTAERGYTVWQQTFKAGLPDTGADSAIAAVNKLDGATPSVTFVVGFPADVVQLMTAAATHSRLQRSAGHQWFLSDSAKDPSIITAATRSTLEGTVGTAPAQGTGAAYLGFTSAFSQRFGVNPNAYSFIAHSSDAMWLTLACVASAKHGGAGLTGPAMSGGIARLLSGTATPLLGVKWNDVSLAMVSGGTIDAQGSSGELQFDLDAGAPSSPYEIWMIADGGISTVRYVTP